MYMHGKLTFTAVLCSTFAAVCASVVFVCYAVLSAGQLLSKPRQRGSLPLDVFPPCKAAGTCQPNCQTSRQARMQPHFTRHFTRNRICPVCCCTAPVATIAAGFALHEPGHRTMPTSIVNLQRINIVSPERGYHMVPPLQRPSDCCNCKRSVPSHTFCSADPAAVVVSPPTYPAAFAGAVSPVRWHLYIHHLIIPTDLQKIIAPLEITPHLPIQLLQALYLLCNGTFTQLPPQLQLFQHRTIWISRLHRLHGCSCSVPYGQIFS